MDDPRRDERAHIPNPHEVVTTKALIVWVAAVSCYIVAILGRTSFGVASVDAIERFEVDASRIAVFASVQMGVYALCQIPSGILIDRFGPRALMISGAIIMAIGQCILALTTSYPLAIGARVLLGAGDATAFLAVMRLLPSWFPLHKAPLFSQMTGALGQTGQFLSAVPFLALLNSAGWTVSFLSLGASSVLIALLALVAVTDQPPHNVYRRPAPTASDELSDEDDPAETAAPTGLKQQLATLLTSSTAWQGFFMHYTCLKFQVTFTLMWGLPLMTLGMGLSPAQAGMVLAINTVVTVITGPLHGIISARSRGYRHWVVIAFSTFIVAGWAVFFLSSAPRGIVAVIIMTTIVALCAPAANYGFDNIREGVEPNVVATSTGLANMGGFISGMVAAQGIGLLLDYASQGAEYSWNDFRFAAFAALGVWIVGVIGILATTAMRTREVSTKSQLLAGFGRKDNRRVDKA